MHVTDENQLTTSDGRLYSHEDCGLVCALSMALDAGAAAGETVAAMEAWYGQHGDSPVDGTGLDVNAAWLRSVGLPGETFVGGMDVADRLLAQGYRLGLAIWSNNYGEPYSGPGCVGHFVEVCWPNGDATYHIMQPVGGLEVTYTRAQLADNGQNAGFVCRHDYRTTAPGAVTAVAGTTSGGSTMFTATDEQNAAATLKLAYDILAIRKACKAKGIDVGDLMVDKDDPQGFATQMQAWRNGEDLHALVNTITTAA